MAHGLHGVAMGLARAYRAGAGPDVRSAAQEVWAAAGSGSPQAASTVTGWCAGAAGVVVAGIELMKIARSPLVSADVERALDVACTAEDLGNHTLCCGRAGLVVSLLEAGEWLGRPDLMAIADTLAHGLPGTTDSAGPGLFTGQAGIAYALLRAGQTRRDGEILAVPGLA